MDVLTRRALVGALQSLVMMTVLIFVSAGTVRFWQGWVYFVIFFVAVYVITRYFLRHDRALIERRLAFGPKDEPSRLQRILQSCALVLFCSLLVVPGLDHRFGWSMVPWPVVVVGDAFVVLAFALVFRVFKENSFAAALVRVEAEQPVISSGLYAHVRHPMYSGAVLLFAGSALALGSWPDLLVAAAVTGLLVARLLDEERHLSAELPGYDQYRRDVRFRLVPYVW